MQLVEKSFFDFPTDKLDRVWGIVFDNLRQGLRSDGGNDYKTLHTGKRKRVTREKIDFRNFASLATIFHM